MALKITKLSKKDFFNNLEKYVGKPSINLMHGSNKIAMLTVSQHSANKPNRFDVKVQYVGNTLKKIEANSFKSNAGVELISGIFSWTSLSFHQEQIFGFRTIEIVEQVKEEAKPSQQESVVIKTTVKPDDDRLVHFRYVEKGTPFWYRGDLYQRTNSDSHNALRIKDGCLCNLHYDNKVLATTIEVSITGECP